MSRDIHKIYPPKTHEKGLIISLIIRKMPIKVTIRYSYIFSGIAKIKKTGKSNYVMQAEQLQVAATTPHGDPSQQYSILLFVFAARKKIRKIMSKRRLIFHIHMPINQNLET